MTRKVITAEVLQVKIVYLEKSNLLSVHDVFACFLWTISGGMCSS